MSFFTFDLPGIRTGGVPEVAEMVQEKFDMELEMAKTLIQQECDETIESETVNTH